MFHLVHTNNARKWIDGGLKLHTLKYACLEIAAQYPMAINISYIGVEADISESLNKITPILFQCFDSKYAGMFILNEVMSKIVGCVFEEFVYSPQLKWNKNVFF